MSDESDERTEDDDDESGGAETLIDLLTGEEIPASPKNRLVQKVLRQLIESYGFDRGDIKAGYRLTTPGRRGKTIDIAILCHGEAHLDENVERVVVCETQKPREKLRSAQEAAGDLRKLHQKLEILPACHLGMWTNGHEEFFVRAEDTTFETRFTNIGAWPAPGEQTDDLLREGGATQVAGRPRGSRGGPRSLPPVPHEEPHARRRRFQAAGRAAPREAPRRGQPRRRAQVLDPRR
jgi:type I restriction enzyme M protein